MFRKTVIITLKSGARIKVKTKDFTVTYNNATRVTGYKFEGLADHSVLHIDVNEIAAVQVSK